LCFICRFDAASPDDSKKKYPKAERMDFSSGPKLGPATGNSAPKTDSRRQKGAGTEDNAAGNRNADDNMWLVGGDDMNDNEERMKRFEAMKAKKLMQLEV
jgi:hypothetical protein